MGLRARWSGAALVTAALAIACSQDVPTAPRYDGTAPASAARGNTLQICHVMGNGSFRTLWVDPGAQADHMAHGDWLPLEFFEDADGDGYGRTTSFFACTLPPGYAENSLDCDDDDPSSYPGAPELLGDHRDNDCDGWVDEGWPSWGTAATEAARVAARNWMAGASVSGTACAVNFAVATAGSSSVSGPSVIGKVSQALLAAGASSTVAAGWDLAFSQAWHGWSQAITIPGLPWYPPFAAWPSAYAAPTPNVPTPLSTMLSIHRSRLEAGALAARVASSIGAEAGEAGADAAIDAFAAAIAARFDASLQIPVSGVLGEGPVPGWHPVFLPAGPVLGGRCHGGTFPTAPWN